MAPADIPNGAAQRSLRRRSKNKLSENSPTHKIFFRQLKIRQKRLLSGAICLIFVYFDSNEAPQTHFYMAKLTPKQPLGTPESLTLILIIDILIL